MNHNNINLGPTLEATNKAATDAADRDTMLAVHEDRDKQREKYARIADKLGAPEVAAAIRSAQ